MASLSFAVLISSTEFVPNSLLITDEWAGSAWDGNFCCGPELKAAPKIIHRPSPQLCYSNIVYCLVCGFYISCVLSQVFH